MPSDGNEGVGFEKPMAVDEVEKGGTSANGSRSVDGRDAARGTGSVTETPSSPSPSVASKKRGSGKRMPLPNPAPKRQTRRSSGGQGDSSLAIDASTESPSSDGDQKEDKEETVAKEEEKEYKEGEVVKEDEENQVKRVEEEEEGKEKKEEKPTVEEDKSKEEENTKQAAKERKQPKNCETQEKEEEEEEKQEEWEEGRDDEYKEMEEGEEKKRAKRRTRKQEKSMKPAEEKEKQNGVQLNGADQQQSGEESGKGGGADDNLPSRPGSKETERGEVGKNQQEDDEAGIDVPDGDFFNFCASRNEKSMSAGQIWALYDDEEGLPRYHAKINKVSLNPFKALITWLERSENQHESDVSVDVGKKSNPRPPTSRKGGGGPKNGAVLKSTELHPTACGHYRFGKRSVQTSMTAFSHLVEWEKRKDRVITVYPSVGQVWALKMGSSGNVKPPESETGAGKYRIVEVFGEWSEKKGVTVSVLEKVEGFNYVFRRASGSKAGGGKGLSAAGELQITPAEAERFSHQVLVYRFQGGEMPNVDQGMMELDSAALPADFATTSN